MAFFLSMRGRLLVNDLGDRAGGAGVLAGAAGHAGVLVGHGGDVVQLENASGAGVNANATSDALVGINYGMSHGSFLSVVPDANRRMSIGCSAKIYRAAHGLQPFGRCFTCHSPSKPRLTARYVRAIASRTVKVVRHREAYGGRGAFDRAPAAARPIVPQLQRVCREVFSEGEPLPRIPDVWENGRAPPGRF